MSKNLHIVPKEPLVQGQKWNAETGHLVFDKANQFEVFVTINEEFYKDSQHLKPEPFNKLSNEEYEKLHFLKKDTYKSQLKNYEKKQLFYEHSLQKLRNEICWCWEAVGKGMEGKVIKHNNSFVKGIRSDLSKKINFPKIIEGGAPAWLEVFAPNDMPTGIRPNGIFVSAIGTPKIIAAEWRDYEGKLITKEIAFGSTVYLHIYTEALYGQNIEIQLRDTNLINADLIPTPSDKDGNPIQKLEINPLTRFTRPVKAYQYTDVNKPPAGSVTDGIITEKKEGQFSISNVQKCVFPVFIEHAWQIQGSGFLDSGEKLLINPFVFHPKIKNQKIDLDDCVLKVSRNGILMQGELKGNTPLLLGDDVKTGAPENQKKIDFTFGIFIDGTLNNLYNTEARQKFEERTGIKADSQKTVEENKEEKYRFVDESSYENDLSNPAIIFKNYITDEENEKHPIFKIYTEGIGTLTTPNEKGEMNAEDYKNDNTVGYGMGTRSVFENAGIKGKVRNAVTAMAKKITEVMSHNIDKTIGTITVDVFGFSRGAAAARNFVHEITYPAYYATAGLESAYCDQHGYTVSEEYFNQKKPLPTNGHLGYLLTQANQKFGKLEIRFAGIYDTVPHHGLKQSNDIEDLGLNSINKANYVVHLVAADEHRANFNLATISSVTKTSPDSAKKGGIELYLPGVHCDVGGSYIEGMPENKNRIDASFSYPELKKLKTELIAQGWFNEEELFIDDGNLREITDANFTTVMTKMALNSRRKYLSNQYSLIPLHMMIKFCDIKGVCISIANVKKEFDFKKNKFEDNIKFLIEIKERLYQYAFNGSAVFEYEEAPKFKQPDVMYDPQQSHKVLQEYHERQIEGQKELDKAAAEKNKNIKLLRNKYLHWNSVYGSKDLTDIALHPHAPNKENGKRKRTEQ